MKICYDDLVILCCVVLFIAHNPSWILYWKFTLDIHLIKINLRRFVRPKSAWSFIRRLRRQPEWKWRTLFSVRLVKGDSYCLRSYDGCYDRKLDDFSAKWFVKQFRVEAAFIDSSLSIILEEIGHMLRYSLDFINRW